MPALAGLVILLATPTGRSLTAGSWSVALVAWVAVCGFAAQVLSRAVFLGVHDLRRYIIVLVGEAVIRLAVAIVVVVGDVTPSGLVSAVIIVSGCFSWPPLLAAVVRSFDWHSPIAEMLAYNPGLDVLVVGDGSGDGTAQVAEAAGVRVARLP